MYVDGVRRRSKKVAFCVYFTYCPAAGKVPEELAIEAAQIHPIMGIDKSSTNEDISLPFGSPNHRERQVFPSQCIPALQKFGLPLSASGQIK